MYSVDCVEGNVKPRAKFWGAIADTYTCNTTTELHRQQTLKNLKDHWSTYTQASVPVQLNLQLRIFLHAKSSRRCHGSRDRKGAV
jgi:hypothetical protein